MMTFETCKRRSVKARKTDEADALSDLNARIETAKHVGDLFPQVGKISG